MGRGRGWAVMSRSRRCRAWGSGGGGGPGEFWGDVPPSPIKGLWSELRGVESEGGGVRRRGRGKCPEVGAGRDSPERRVARSTLARAPAVGLGGGVGARGEPARSGPGGPVEGGLRRGGVEVPGSPWIWQAVTQFSNIWPPGASGPASLRGSSASETPRSAWEAGPSPAL